MLWILPVLGCALLLSGSRCQGAKQPHWLTSSAELSAEEQQQRNFFDLFLHHLDANSDSKISLEELTAGKAGFIDGEDKFLTKEVLKKVVVGKPGLLLPEVFEDMWWLMTSDMEADVKDYTDILFNHVDINSDGLLDREELTKMVISGSRRKDSPHPKTELHDLLQSLDADKSGGLSHKEIWGVVAAAIGSIKEKALPTQSLAGHLRKESKIVDSVLDWSVVARCMDYNKNEIITLDEEIDFVPLFDFNYSGEIEECEVTNIGKAFQYCVDNPDKARGRDKDSNLFEWKEGRHTEL